MGRKFLVINLLILAGVVFLSRYLTSEWKSFEEQNNVQRVLDKAKKNPGPVPDLEPTPPPLPAQPYPDFTVIPENDLFMAERRPPSPEVIKPPEQEPQFPKPPALNGVLNGNGKTQALMTIFENQNSKGQSRIMSIGDVISGWTITEIKETSVKLTWKDHEKVIDMFDSAPQQPSAAPQSMAKAAVTVITIGSAAAAVETVEASAPPGGEGGGGPGLVVGVSGGQGGANQGGQQRGGQGGLSSSRGGRGVGSAGSSRSGRMGNTSGQGGMQGGSGVMGVPGGGGSVPFNSGVRRNQ